MYRDCLSVELVSWIVNICCIWYRYSVSFVFVKVLIVGSSLIIWGRLNFVLIRLICDGWVNSIDEEKFEFIFINRFLVIYLKKIVNSDRIIRGIIMIIGVLCVCR